MTREEFERLEIDDKIKFKSKRELIKEFGIDSQGNIKTKMTIYIDSHMMKYLNTTRKIIGINYNEGYIEVADIYSYSKGNREIPWEFSYDSIKRMIK